MKKPAGLLKSENGAKIIFAAGIVLIVLIFLFSLSGKDGETTDSSAQQQNVLSQIEEYEQRLEERLTRIIGEIQGTGEITVMITLEKSEESLYSDRETNVSATVTPTVRGAVVVCEGSENAIVKQKIVDAVCKALGVSAARVCVTY